MKLSGTRTNQSRIERDICRKEMRIKNKTDEGITFA